MLILLFVISVYPAGVLVVQLQALLTCRGLTVLRHHQEVLKKNTAKRRVTETMGSGRGMEKQRQCPRKLHRLEASGGMTQLNSFPLSQLLIDFKAGVRKSIQELSQFALV